jgi:hypothetical protein
LDGNIRESFLIDNSGLPAIKNQEAAWETVQNAADRKQISLLCNGTSYNSTYHDQSQISIDGIFLCGVAGRPKWQEDFDVKMHLGNRPTHIECNPYSLDVRGNSKPEITPAREPVEHVWRLPPKWKALSNIVNQAGGRLWIKLLEQFSLKGLTSETFWQLIVIHNGDATYIPLNGLWSYVSVPLINSEEENWAKISGLTKLTVYQNEDDRYFVTSDNQHVKLPLSFAEWEKSGIDHPKIQFQINSIIIALSSLAIENDRVTLNIYPPDNDQITTASFAITGDRTYIQTLRYINNVKEAITVQAPIKTANSSHPLVQQCMTAQDTDALSKFASSFVPCVVDAVYSKEQKRSFTKPDRWMKYSAHCYFTVDWSKYQETRLKPPYKIWLENDGIIEITESDLMMWRDAKTAV